MSDYTPENIECNLTFVGLEVMMDPPSSTKSRRLWQSAIARVSASS